MQELKQQYQRIKAPPYLATRIRAQAPQRPARRPAWVPVAAMVTVAFGVLSVALIVQQQASHVVAPPRPSLSMLSRLTPDKPGFSVPGMSRIRTVKRPALPPKPDFRNTEQPQSYFKIEEQDSKEMDYA